VATQDERLAAIATAAATVLRQTPYHAVRAGDVAAAVRLPGETGRSAVWLYNEVRNRRVLVALAAADAWRDYADQAPWSAPGQLPSVTAARATAVAALGMIVAFHRAEQPLMTQVGYGIGDISTAEKRHLASGGDLAVPSWPDSYLGRVATGAWGCRCDVFTDFLAPVLRACAESVTYLAEENVVQSASRLSDLTFRACLTDRDGPVDLVARGLVALWFERELTRFAGSLPHDLESSETALAVVARRGTDSRAEANASAVVVRLLLEAGTLHGRCVEQARHTVARWQRLAADPPAGQPISHATAHDLQRLSDAASHLGMAASRYGDRRRAAEAWQLSRRVAEEGLGNDRSRIARADNNLAELAAERGRGQQASQTITDVFRTRMALLESHPHDRASWRRLTVTARTRADIARINGQVVDGVRLAADLLANRQTRLGDSGHADIAEARLVLGQAWLTAGHPVVARHHMEEAADIRRGRFLATSSRVQEDVMWLAKTALVLEQPRTALELLAGQASVTDWFCARVSFRQGYTARRLLALATGGVGRIDEAVAALLADRERLEDLPLDPGLDPLVADFDRSLGELELLRDEPAAAAALLTSLAEAEAKAGTPLPGRAWTLILLGQAASRLGDADRAAECFRSVTELANDGAAGIDRCHPVVLTARHDEAVRRAARGNAREAAGLLAPLLDRNPLPHGRPALGEVHPLLGRARALAGRLGITLPRPMPAADEASLDIDA
jgi:tetratricopeptide (TPR) repeat protein